MEHSNAGAVEGKLFLYENPEMLALEDHEALGITPVAAPYANTREHNAIPITTTEFRSAQKDYPIVFTGHKDPYPLAIVGVAENKNLFLDNNNEWEANCYVPAYLRCYPFAFAQLGDDQMAVVIDRASPMVTESPEFPFFENGDVTEHTTKMRDFAAHFVAERKKTEAFCKMLVEKELLTDQHVTHRPKGADKEEVLANYAAIDAQKVNELSSDELQVLHQSGDLAAIYAHMFSLENWNKLLQRRAA